MKTAISLGAVDGAATHCQKACDPTAQILVVSNVNPHVYSGDFIFLSHVLSPHAWAIPCVH